ncbi:Vacuolar protein sorting-associated protein 11 [Neolecta irregularis DAH-3]|uniref:E3 ubiquitin-protein ligase PEP5 n=1 Tax=Neolecta irregularis (strain DAH-3) TaxID=1198029 RepID=A0A1U7LW60_NEOID|nr:Vacuolar protein sorting-associated protein 11 [Neolecta irregularis DAH-3]|eukprot:OLL26859.1 Vacuolar protein sorting-associated protein 11 [Neolecta irregularis DAH-3]
MALASWRQFYFFNATFIRDEQNRAPAVFRAHDINTIASSDNSILLGDSEGRVHLVASSFKVALTFIVYDQGRISHMRTVSGLLVTIGNELVSEPIIKVWALNNIDRKTNVPISSFTLNTGRKPFPVPHHTHTANPQVSAFTVFPDLTQVAVGFSNGTVILVRGDLARDRGAKQRVIFESEEPITGLEFVSGSKMTLLYVVTTARVLTYTCLGKGQGQPVRVLDSLGAGLNCTSITQDGNLVIIREDAVYFYKENNRGPCYAFEGTSIFFDPLNQGQKSLLKTFNGYLAVVSPQPHQTSKFKSMSPVPPDPFETSKVTLLDTENKFIAHVSSLPNDVKHIFSAWGELYVLLIDGSVLRLAEKEMSAKLEILYQKSLYMLAINLAQAKHLDLRKISEIVKRYGDHLYNKGDYDSAMQQYIKSIGAVQPSLVIRKYLDAQRIHNLTSFLEELHNRRLANSDHTTLLLNCYAKLKDVEKLQKFVTSDEELKFDLETAITVCRQAGFNTQAAYLAKRYGQVDTLMAIMIEDLKEYSSSLNYIRRMEPDNVVNVLEIYGKSLLDKLPQEMTNLYIELYTGKYTPFIEDDPVAESTLQVGPFASFMTLPAITNLNFADYLPYRSANSISSSVISPPPSQRETSIVETGFMNIPAPVKPTYQVPKPRSAFAVFVDHPKCFVQFLEACLEIEPTDQDVRLALFEGYLGMARLIPDEKDSLHCKAKDLLTSDSVNLVVHFTADPSQATVDPPRALLLSHLCDFSIGKDLIRERSGLKVDIFQSYTIANNVQGAISALNKYGMEEPELYPLALTYFTSSPDAMEAAGDEFLSVLRKIEQDALMAPLQVVQALSGNAIATIGAVKSYLAEIIDKEKREIENNRKLIESYKSDTLKKKNEIKDLQQSARVFQVTRCSACGGSLELPVIHYLCKHSFHHRCINDTEDSECPQCASGNAAVRALVRAHDEMADRNDLFHANVTNAQDKFKAMLEFPGVLNLERGLLVDSYKI